MTVDILGDVQEETESHRVDQQDNLKKISDDEADLSELIKMIAKDYQHLQSFTSLVVPNVVKIPKYRCGR